MVNGTIRAPRLAAAGLLLSLVNTHPLRGQAAPASPPKPPAGAIASRPDWPEAKPGDADTIEHLVAALYDVISGPAHRARDWARMRSLFVPGARLIPVRAMPPGPDGKPPAPASDVTFLSVDDWIARVQPRFEAEGFFERGVHTEVWQFGNIVSVFSTYESSHAPGDATPFARGINSIQLLKDGDRYRIVDVFWDAERPGLVIPPRYLPGAEAAGGLASNFVGDWTGQLEYRDYRTDERVLLPTWLSVTPAQADGTVALNYTYDDGPAKVVYERTTLSLDAKAQTATLVSGDDRAGTQYSVEGFEDFTRRNRGTLRFEGKGTENGKPVEVRISVSLGRNLLTWRKETRAAGTADEFKFRDGYTLTRAEAPKM